jgi:hypothetical protein
MRLINVTRTILNSGVYVTYEFESDIQSEVELSCDSQDGG